MLCVTSPFLFLYLKNVKVKGGYICKSRKIHFCGSSVGMFISSLSGNTLCKVWESCGTQVEWRCDESSFFNLFFCPVVVKWDFFCVQMCVVAREIIHFLRGC